MGKTINEVRNYLDGLVGTITPDQSDHSLDGQCVSLIKNLLSFIGVPNPYEARGNAKDLPDTYVSQGIAQTGKGILNILVNRNGGNGYGHVWVKTGEDNWQANANGFPVKKNYREDSITDIVNLDQWLTAVSEKGEIGMYLINCKDTGYWYVSDGVEIRYIRTTRMLDNYCNQFGKLNLPVDVMFQEELDAEFGKNATDVNRDVSKG